MPYKDKEKQKKFQREWARKNKEVLNDNLKKSRTNRKTMIDEYLGRICAVCDRTMRALQCHRKDGSKHTNLKDMALDQLKQEMSDGLYIRVCGRCHIGIHWTMNHLNYDWRTMSAMLGIEQ